MSDTPRTDAASWREHQQSVVDADFARQLERDLAQRTAERDALAAEVAALKAEVSRISLRWEIADHRVSLLWAERDEARRELCHYKYRSIMDECPDANTAPQLIARNRGWDCFEEAKP
jgi:hypothetical protein